MLAAAVGLDAIAFATVLRPRHGYTSAHRLLVALAVGLGAALAASIIAGAGTAFAQRRPRSLWTGITALSTLGAVLALFIAAAAGSRLVLVLRPDSQRAAASTQAARTDFRRWQATVVPIAVRWMDAMRSQRPFRRGLPTTGINELRRRVDRADRTFGQLTRSLAADSRRLPQRPALRRLTSELTLALVIAQRAQASYERAIGSASHPRSTGPGRTRNIGPLVNRGNREATRSARIMYAFSLEANKLGASLFAQQP